MKDIRNLAYKDRKEMIYIDNVYYDHNLQIFLSVLFYLLAFFSKYQYLNQKNNNKFSQKNGLIYVYFYITIACKKHIYLLFQENLKMFLLH